MPSEDPRVALLEEQLRELTKRTGQLETQVERLRALVDSDREAFTYLCLESNLTSAQARKLLDLMEVASKSLKGASPMSNHDFEAQVYGIVPSHDGDYHFAESVVSTLHQEGGAGIADTGLAAARFSGAARFGRTRRLRGERPRRRAQPCRCARRAVAHDSVTQ